MPAVSNMLSLPIEIWRNRILSQLSVNDQCRLDSAVQNRTTRETLHEALFGSEIPFETIITPEIIEWIMNKGIRPLQIKITEDITANDMLRFTEFCPQIKSIDTCRYEDDVQDVQEKSRMDDDDDAEYEARDMDETSLSNILLICKSLKKLRICDFQPEEWWDVLPRIMPMCGQLDELTYNEPRPFNDGGRLDYTFFSLTRTKFHIKAEKMVDLGCVVLRALSSLQIAELKLDIAGIGGDFTDTEVSKIARCCPLLEVAEIDMCLSIGAFIDFCQCCNHLTDLSIHDVHEDYFWDPACIRRACSFLHGIHNTALCVDEL